MNIVKIYETNASAIPIDSKKIYKTDDQVSRVLNTEQAKEYVCNN